MTSTARWIADEYEVLESLGRGSMGQVRRARERASAREVALKLLTSDEAERVFALKQEFRRLADIRHPNLVALYDLRSNGRDCCFTMELVRGVPFDAYVAAGPAATVAERLQRLYAILPQLVAAVTTLHRLELVHRDLKPPNVLVAAGEPPRAVVLDFGLGVPATPDPRDRAAAAGFTGTIAYMAPEQIWSRDATAAVDWYAVGVMVFAAVAGRLPYEGRPHEVASTKLAPPAHRLAELVPEVPAWLDALVARQLAVEPGARPNDAEVATYLCDAGIVAPDGTPAAPPMPSRRSVSWDDPRRDASPFVGRDRELALLRAAVGVASDRGPDLATAVLVRGESGIGKTELVRRFLSTLGDEWIVLRGRCHPHESVPYNALDQVVDDLSRALLIDGAGAARLAPERGAALVQLFPVLRRVPELAALGEPALGGSPIDRRREAARGLGDLFAGGLGDGTTVLWIDDAQWADADSASVLAIALDHVAERSAIDPSATTAAPPVRVLVSFRDAGDDDPHLLATLARYPSAVVEVGPLTPDAARELASRLAGTHGTPLTVDDTTIARESRGSPFFVGELVRDAESSDLHVPDTGAAAVTPRVEEIIARRYTTLAPPLRRLLEITCVAGAPLPQAVTLDVLGAGAGSTALGELERRCLVTTLDRDAGRMVQPYHDRIAEAVRGRLDDTTRVATHLAVAETLERRGDRDADAELLVYHFSGARRLEAAARYAVRGALLAARALAFTRAVELYELALEHGDASLDRASLYEGLAEALANSGYGARSGQAFRQAAATLAAARRDDARVADLERRGAEQLMRCGRIDDGIAAMRAVLARLGERLPERRGEGLRSFLWQRARLRWRGLAFEQRTAETAAGVDSVRVRAMWSTSVSVSMVSPTLSAALSTRHFLDALDRGSRARVAQSFAYEATWLASWGGERRRRAAAHALQTARELTDGGDATYEQAWLDMAAGIVAWLSGHWVDAVPDLERAARDYRQRCPGAFFEIALTNQYLIGALALGGELARLREVVLREAREAGERGDLFAAHSCHMGESVAAWLLRDEPDVAIALADTAISAWPTGAFLTQHYQHLLTVAQAELYAGDAPAAWTRVTRAWPALRRAGILAMEVPANCLRFLRARTALAMLDGGTPPAAGTTRRRLLAHAARDARRIARADSAYAAGLAASLRAGIAACAGRDTEAETALHTAIAAYHRAGMRAHESAARLRMAADDTAGGAWASAEGCADPRRLAASLVPGFGRP